MQQVILPPHSSIGTAGHVPVLSRVEGNQNAGPKSCLTHGQVLCLSSMNIDRCFAPVVMGKEQPGHTGLATLPIIYLCFPKPTCLSLAFLLLPFSFHGQSQYLRGSDLPLYPLLVVLCHFWVDSEAISCVWS